MGEQCWKLPFLLMLNVGSLRKTDEDVTERLRQRNFAQKAEIKGFLGLGFEKLSQLGIWVNWLKGTRSNGKTEGHIRGQAESGISLQAASIPSKVIKTESKAKWQLSFEMFPVLLRAILSLSY